MRILSFLSFVLIVIVSSSCTKEAKLNKKIDDLWKVTEVNGQEISTSESLFYEFTKDKKGKGNVKTTSVDESGTSTDFNGTYILIEDTKMTITINHNGFFDSQDYIIIDYSRSKLKIANSSGTIIEMKKE
jgi:imidazole glycerol phosphate synthase subunit HisF